MQLNWCVYTAAYDSMVNIGPPPPMAFYPSSGNEYNNDFNTSANQNMNMNNMNMNMSMDMSMGSMNNSFGVNVPSPVSGLGNSSGTPPVLCRIYPGSFCLSTSSSAAVFFTSFLLFAFDSSFSCTVSHHLSFRSFLARSVFPCVCSVSRLLPILAHCDVLRPVWFFIWEQFGIDRQWREIFHWRLV